MKEEDTELSSNPFWGVETGEGLEDMAIENIEPSFRQIQKWERVSSTEKAQIVKAVTRLLLLKGRDVYVALL